LRAELEAEDECLLFSSSSGGGFSQVELKKSIRGAEIFFSVLL